MLPPLAVSMPPKIFKRVVFPAPLGPKITTNSPLFIPKFILSKAVIFIFP